MLKNLSVFLISCCLCLFLLELALRAYYAGEFPRNYYKLDERSGLIGAASNYSGHRTSEYGKIIINTNQIGFRGELFNQKDTARKVLIIGDSFVQAIQVNIESTFGYLLANSTKSNYQVMQVAIPGWGQGDQLHWIKTYFDDFNPHIIVIPIFLGNDLSIDNMGEKNRGSSYYIPVRNGLILREHYAGRFDKLKGESELISFVQRKLNKRKQDQQKASINNENYVSIAHYHEKFLPIYHTDEAKREQYYRVFFKLIQQIIDCQKEKEFQFLPVIIPWDKAMDEAKFHYILNYFELPYEDYSVNLPHNIIANHFKKMKLPFIDLREIFEQKNNPLDAYGKVDTHFSPRGHKWTFEALEGQLLELGW